MKLKKSSFAVVGALAISAGAFAFAAPASAHVVCNRAGDCWSTHEMFTYPSELGIRVYNDRYADEAYRERRWHRYHRRWHDEDHDHDRGFWRDGVWITF
jgi:hypothetical protein